MPAVPVQGSTLPLAWGLADTLTGTIRTERSSGAARPADPRAESQLPTVVVSGMGTGAKVRSNGPG